MDEDGVDHTYDYGINKTKRPTVLEAERLLGVRVPSLRHSETQLVDYMGGDAAIINAATNFYGLDAVGGMNPKDFMLALRTSGITAPFTFAEVKVNAKVSIDAAKKIVPFKRASVNEYSGRYSVMSDQFENSAEGELGDRITAAQREAYGAYDGLVSDKAEPRVDFTRELARSILPFANQTQFYWKLNLEDVFAFLKQNPNPHLTLKPFVEQLRVYAQAIAPLAYHAFQAVDENGERFQRDIAIDDRKRRGMNRKLDAPYGISETRRLTVPKAEEDMFVVEPVLGDGFVALTDYMGTDESIVQAARVSYGRGTKKVSEDRGLIRYLARHLHTTPSEMIEAAFVAKLPGFILRQLIRHRTLDETGFLGRIVPEEEAYVPPRSEMRSQSTANKQGRGNELEDDLKVRVDQTLRTQYDNQRALRAEAEAAGVHPDITRQIPGVGYFVGWSFKGDVKNFNHLLGLRLDSHAQKESQVYGQAVAKRLKRLAPTAYEAFEDYHQHAKRFSRLEMIAVSKMLSGSSKEEAIAASGLKGRELEELQAKLNIKA